MRETADGAMGPEGGRIVTNLFEAAGFEYPIRAACRCRRAAVFQPHALWWKFYRQDWKMGLGDARERFRCRRRGRRSRR